jgi:hypothetical protein
MSKSIVSVHLGDDGWYVILRRMERRHAEARARRNRIPGKVKSRAFKRDGIWYLRTKVRK